MVASSPITFPCCSIPAVISRTGFQHVNFSPLLLGLMPIPSLRTSRSLLPPHPCFPSPFPLSFTSITISIAVHTMFWCTFINFASFLSPWFNPYHDFTSHTNAIFSLVDFQRFPLESPSPSLGKFHTFVDSFAISIGLSSTAISRAIFKVHPMRFSLVKPPSPP